MSRGLTKTERAHWERRALGVPDDAGARIMERVAQRAAQDEIRAFFVERDAEPAPPLIPSDVAQHIIEEATKRPTREQNRVQRAAQAEARAFFAELIKESKAVERAEVLAAQAKLKRVKIAADATRRAEALAVKAKLAADKAELAAQRATKAASNAQWWAEQVDVH